MRSNFGNAGVSSLTVRIYNHSARDTLDKAEFHLLIEDCDKKRAGCATVDEEKGSFYLEVPPQQARNTTVSTTPPWSQVTILGTPRIKVLITKAIAAK